MVLYSLEQATGHILVPKHVIASEEEVKQLLERIQKPVESLPIILINDAALNGLEAKPGDVVRVERFSAITQKTEPYYRLVVEE